MPIKVDSTWRFAQPSAQIRLGPDTVTELLALARKIQGEFTHKHVLEAFKMHLCRASGQSYSLSSSTDWAESDLMRVADAAAEHGPNFLAAFFDACEELGRRGAAIPGDAAVNQVLLQTRSAFRVQDGSLVLSTQMVATPITSANPADAVSRALADAEALLGQAGASSAIDRAHTALHGYLRQLCTLAGLSVGEDETTARLFKALRLGHPAFKPQGPRADDIGRMLAASGTIIDALVPIRNKASLAHSNDLLDEPEAAAVLNAARTVFHYAQACIARSTRQAD